MKKSKSYYYPAHDSRTGRLEFIAFSGLGLAGAVLITAAIIDSWRFAQNRDGIIQAWSTPQPAQIEHARRSPDQTLTNFLRVHASTPLTQSDASAGAPASAGSQTPLPRWQITMDGVVH